MRQSQHFCVRSKFRYDQVIHHLHFPSIKVFSIRSRRRDAPDTPNSNQPGQLRSRAGRDNYLPVTWRENRATAEQIFKVSGDHNLALTQRLFFVLQAGDCH